VGGCLEEGDGAGERGGGEGCGEGDDVDWGEQELVSEEMLVGENGGDGWLEKREGGLQEL